MVQQPSLFGRLVAWLGWLVVGICLVVILGLVSSSRDYYDTTGGVSEKYHSLSKTARNKVAVIDASGVIMQGDGFVKRQIDRIREDDNVRAVVLRVDSPGGTITGSDYIYHHLVKLREDRKLPIVVSMGSIAASGGYYIAMAVGDQEQSVYAEPTTTTGSIGVIIPHYDVTGLMEDLKIKDDSIATHPRKQMLSMTKQLTEDDRVILERYIGHAFDRFKEIVKAGRPRFSMNEEALEELATGEIFTAEQAKESGLIDEIGFVEDAIERAITIANLDSDDVRVVTFKQPATLSAALGLGKISSPGLGLAQLLELSTPKAYYLATSLPLLVSTHQ
jgi:protease-4